MDRLDGTKLREARPDNAPAKDKVPTSTGVVLIEKLASPSEIFQQKEDQKRKEKVERFKYSPDN